MGTSGSPEIHGRPLIPPLETEQNTTPTPETEKESSSLVRPPSPRNDRGRPSVNETVKEEIERMGLTGPLPPTRATHIDQPWYPGSTPPGRGTMRVVPQVSFAVSSTGPTHGFGSTRQRRVTPVHSLSLLTLPPQFCPLRPLGSSVLPTLLRLFP